MFHHKGSAMVGVYPSAFLWSDAVPLTRVTVDMLVLSDEPASEVGNTISELGGVLKGDVEGGTIVEVEVLSAEQVEVTPW